MLKLGAEKNENGRKKLSLMPTEHGIDEARQKLLFKSGSVKLNGKTVKSDFTPKHHDEIEIDGIYEDIKASELVIYNDENFFVMSKPCGMDCVTLKETGRDTLYGFAAEFMKAEDEYDIDRLMIPYICEQIDKGSGGLVMIAKTEEMFNLLMQAVRERRIIRILSAYVGSIPRKPSGELIDYASSVLEDEKIIINRKQEKGMLPVITRYRVIDSNEGVSLIEATNLNGGVSVMRAQLAYNAMPVVGDNEYGDKEVNQRFTPTNPAIAVERFIFSTGVGNPLEYLNAKTISSEESELPELRMKNQKQKSKARK